MGFAILFLGSGKPRVPQKPKSWNNDIPMNNLRVFSCDNAFGKLIAYGRLPESGV